MHMVMIIIIIKIIIIIIIIIIPIVVIISIIMILFARNTKHFCHLLKKILLNKVSAHQHHHLIIYCVPINFINH